MPCIEDDGTRTVTISRNLPGYIQEIFPFIKVAGTCCVMSAILIAQLLKTKSVSIKYTAASDYYFSICACGQIHSVGKNLALAGR